MNKFIALILIAGAFMLGSFVNSQPPTYIMYKGNKYYKCYDKTEYSHTDTVHSMGTLFINYSYSRRVAVYDHFDCNDISPEYK